MSGRVHRAYLSLGSNIRPELHLPAAVQLLAQHGRVSAVSHVWQSKPWGYSKQPDFLNAAVLLETALPGEWLIETLIPSIEQQLERRRDPQNKNGPRTIDLDLSLWNDTICTFGNKHIPDPAVLERAFVAQPLADIAPNYVHPVTREQLADIASRLRRSEALQRRDDVVLWQSAPVPLSP